MNNAIAQGDWRLMFLQHDLLKDVQPADLVRVAKAYFKPSNRTVGYYIPDMNPDRTVVPPRPDLAATLRDYKSAVTVVRGESFDPTIANIDEPRGARPAGQRHAGGRPLQEDRQQHRDGPD